MLTPLFASVGRKAPKLTPKKLALSSLHSSNFRKEISMNIHEPALPSKLLSRQLPNKALVALLLVQKSKALNQKGHSFFVGRKTRMPPCFFWPEPEGPPLLPSFCHNRKCSKLEAEAGQGKQNRPQAPRAMPPAPRWHMRHAPGAAVAHAPGDGGGGRGDGSRVSGGLSRDSAGCFVMATAKRRLLISVLMPCAMWQVAFPSFVPEGP